MGRFTFTLVCVTLFTSATALYTLIPQGKELIYQYRGEIGAATEVPSSYASSFILDGNLHLQTDGNATYVHLSDLHYKLHNGEVNYYEDWWDTVKELPVSAEFDVLQHPFKITYEPSGQALGIVAEEGEPQWSLNIKRGVASMLQLNTEKIQWDTKSPYAFNCKEHTLYGKGQTYYTVYPNEDHWSVKKAADPHSGHHLYSHLWTNMRMTSCDARYDEPLTRDSSQTYNIITKDGQHILKSLESDGGLTYTPRVSESVAYFIFMNQSLVLKTMDASTELFTITNPKFYAGLTYYYADYESKEDLSDIFHGRHKFDMDKLLVELESKLYDNLKYMKEDHTDMSIPDVARAQLPNRILILMHHLDYEHLEAMTDKLMQKTGDDDKAVLQIYYNMLPMIGTHCSLTYMMKMIKTKKVKDRLALEWLQNMPAYTKMPTKSLVESMRDMLYWGDEISPHVRNAAIVAFGSFIDKAVFDHNKLNHINKWTEHHVHETEENFTPNHELNTIFPGPKYYIKYVAHMAEKLRAAEDIATRSAYLSALRNTRLEDAIEHLWPIAKGEVWDDNYLRLMALKALSGLIPPHKEELIYEVFWPLMTDFKLNTNLRVGAYLSIMGTRPSVYRMINIYWHMYNEVNPAFYKFHYTYLESIAHSTDPCLANFRVIVKQIMRYMEKIEYPGVMGVHRLDYMDTKYQYGYQFNGWMVHTPFESESTFSLSVDYTVENAKFPLNYALVHFDGVDASIFKDVALNVNEPNKALNFGKIWKAYQNPSKDIQVNIALFNYDQVVMVYHYNATNIKEFMHFLDIFTADKYSYIKQHFSIKYPIQSNILVPTDIGFLGLFKIYMPQAIYFDVKINKDVVNDMITFQFEGLLKEWLNGRYGLSFYNPFIDSFHGVHRYQTVEMSHPFYFDMSLNPSQQSIKFSWKRHQDPVKDTLAYKSYSATYTFVRDDSNNGLLQTCSKESSNWALVTVNDDKEDHILYESDNPNTGTNIILGQFGGDTYMRNVSIYNQMSFLHHSENTNHGLLKYLHAFHHFVWQPQPTVNGLLWRVQPSKLYPVTNIDVNLRFTKEYKRSEWLLTPASKYNFRATYAVHNNDAVTRSWDANVILDHDENHQHSNLKATYSRIIPGQKEWRICVDATRKFTSEGVDATATMAMSHSAEPKCTEDEKIISTTVKAEKLPAQIDNKHEYGDCYDKMWSDIHEQNSLNCYYARDSLRKWTYDVKTYDMPTEFKKTIKDGLDWMKFKYLKYMTLNEGASLELEKDSFKVVHEYPLIGNKVDLHIYTPEHDYKFGGVPTSEHAHSQIHLAYTHHISPLFRIMHRIGWTKTCEINEKMIVNPQGEEIMTAMPEDWTMYVGDAETNAKHGIWAKKVGEEAISMKVMHEEHVIEISPKGKKVYEVIVDGQKLPEGTYQHSEQWIWMDWVNKTGVVSVVSILGGAHILYDGHHLLVEIPTVDIPRYGPCRWK